MIVILLFQIFENRDYIKTKVYLHEYYFVII